MVVAYILFDCNRGTLGEMEILMLISFFLFFFFQQMERIFPWFKVKESRFWEKQNVSAK